MLVCVKMSGNKAVAEARQRRKSYLVVLWALQTIWLGDNNRDVKLTNTGSKFDQLRHGQTLT